MLKGKVLVTGGAGFIGSHTAVELYQAGFQPIIIDNFANSNPNVLKQLERLTGHQIPFYEADCTESDALHAVFQQEGDVAGVIHFAAFKAVGESVSNPTAYYRNNIGSTAALLDAMHAFKVNHFVFSSSCTVYGQPESMAVTEETPIQQAESPYGFTKQVCERLIQEHHQAHPEVHATLLRYFNPIGSHPSAIIGELPLGTPNNLIPFLTQTVAGIRSELTIFGDDYPTPDGTCVRDYIHVVDLAKAHVAALIAQTKSRVSTYNLGTGRGASVKEVIRAFEEATGLSVPHQIGPRRPGDVAAIYANPRKAHLELGWKTELTLKDALADAWRWQQSLQA
jgi:UDP-glucose 4-epimerase